VAAQRHPDGSAARFRTRRRRLAAGLAVVVAAFLVSAALALSREGAPAWSPPVPASGPAGAAGAPDVPRGAPAGADPGAPAPPAPGAARPLEIGLTEFIPALVAPGPAPPGFGPWRDAAAALRPDRFRLVVDWSALQPDPGTPADLAQPRDGCLRGLPPCAPYAGIRDLLRAVAARQAQDGGWDVVVVLVGVPDWAARPPGGCERPRAVPRSRPLSARGREGYRRLIADLLALGRAERVDLTWWSPWNEPNHSAFLSPQRAACDAASPAASPAVYAEIVRLAARALDGTGARLVLGELAGFRSPGPRATGVGEFVRALPDEVACAARVWSQHEYASPEDEPAPPFARDAVAEVQAALAERACTRDLPLWVTETGVGGGRPGDERPTGAAQLARQCAAQAARLERWAADPRVAAAFQYLFREDTAYPVGLADPALQVLYPTHALWLAWGQARGDVAPARPPGCGAN
jgi:hypothetical protein